MNGESFVSDAELGDVAEFARLEVAFFDINIIPKDGAGGRGHESGDGAEEGAFAAAGRADDCAEMAHGEGEGDLVEKRWNIRR